MADGMFRVMNWGRGKPQGRKGREPFSQSTVRERERAGESEAGRGLHNKPCKEILLIKF